MKFIPIDKIQILRDRSNSGDSKATDILNAQLNGEDYDQLFSDYFNPKQDEAHGVHQDEHDEPKSDLDIKVIDSPEDMEGELHEHEPHHHHEGLDIKMVDENGEHEEHHCMFGDKVSKGIANLIGEIDAASMELVNNDEINGSTKSGIMESLNELKKQSIAAIEKLKSIRKDIDSKHKKDIK